jgi:cell division septal protein FtsQ
MVWTILFVASFLVVVILANTWKGDLKVTDIRVEGNQIVGDEEVLSLAGIKNGDSLFEIDLFKAQERVQKNLFVKSVSAKREVPNCIVLSIVERAPIVAAVVDQVQFLDNEGFILPPAAPGSIMDLPIITGKLDKSQFTPGHQVGSTSIKEAVGIATVAREIGDELYRRISEIHIDGNKSLVFYTAEYGVPVIFGHGDIDGKLLKFNAFWKDFVIYRGSHELRYVDLRFEDQVVVRWKPGDGKAHSTSNVPIPAEKLTPVATINLASIGMTSQ